MGRRTALSQELRMKTQPRFHDSFPMKNREGGGGGGLGAVSRLRSQRSMF